MSVNQSRFYHFSLRVSCLQFTLWYQFLSQSEFLGDKGNLVGNHQGTHRINRMSGEECLGKGGETREMRQREMGLGCCCGFCCNSQPPLGLITMTRVCQPLGTARNAGPLQFCTFHRTGSFSLILQDSKPQVRACAGSCAP